MNDRWCDLKLDPRYTYEWFTNIQQHLNWFTGSTHTRHAMMSCTLHIAQQLSLHPERSLGEILSTMVLQKTTTCPKSLSQVIRRLYTDHRLSCFAQGSVPSWRTWSGMNGYMTSPHRSMHPSYHACVWWRVLRNKCSVRTMFHACCGMLPVFHRTRMHSSVSCSPPVFASERWLRCSGIK